MVAKCLRSLELGKKHYKKFDAAMDEQRQRAKASWKGAAKQTANPEYQKLPTSVFEGYRQTRSEGSEVLALLKGGQGAKELKPGDEGPFVQLWLSLDQTVVRAVMVAGGRR